jgi:hypothetical protein
MGQMHEEAKGEGDLDCGRKSNRLTISRPGQVTGQVLPALA